MPLTRTIGYMKCIGRPAAGLVCCRGVRPVFCL
jgi:hypothetical protein